MMKRTRPADLPNSDNDDAHLLTLPTEILCSEIFQYLDPFHVFTLGFTCKSLFALTNKARVSWIVDLSCRSLLRTSSPSLSYIQWVMDYFRYRLSLNDVCFLFKEAIRIGALEIIEWFYFEFNCNGIGACLAAEYGQLEILQWFIKHRAACGADVSLTAAIKGHIDIVKWCYEIDRCDHLLNICCHAAENGHFDIVNWTLGLGVDLNNIHLMKFAAQFGHTEFLENLTVHNITNNGPTLTQFASKGGQLDTLKQLVQRGCRVNYASIKMAAIHGHFEVVKWLHEKYWFCDICTEAATGGHLEILKWAHEKGAPWNFLTCDAAVKNGHLEVLKYLRENDCPWISGTFIKGVHSGKLELVKWLVENNCPIDPLACRNAGFEGHLEILKYLQEIGCEWDESVYNLAFVNDHYDICLWARANGCPVRRVT